MLKNFWFRHKRSLLILVLGFVCTTWPVVSHGPVDWDSAQYLLGLEHFSVNMHQPHPPGYPLFILTGKLLSLLVSQYTSLLIINMLFSVAAIFGLYVLVWQIWRQRWLATTLALAFMVNPIFWYYRSLANTYTIDAAVSIWLALLTYLFLRSLTTAPNVQYLYASALLLGVGSGFRPSVLVLLLPLLILQWVYYPDRRDRLVSAAVLLVAVASWLVPLVIISGGVPAYWQASLQLYSKAATGGSWLFGASWFDAITQLRHFAVTVLVSLNWLALPIIITVVLFVRDIRWRIWKNDQLYLWWGLAWGSLAIVVYGFVHFGQIGYALTILPLAYVLAGRGAEWLYYEFYRQSSVYLKMMGVTFFVILIVGQASTFLLFTPAYANPDYVPARRIDAMLQRIVHLAPALTKTNLSFVWESDARIQRLVQLIQQYPAEQTLVVAGRNVFYPATRSHVPVRNDEIFRELSASLPNYQVVQLSPKGQTYLSAKNAMLQEVKGSEVRVSNDITYVIFAFDQLAGDQIPKGIIVERRPLSAQQAYYIGSLDWPFQFLGYTIQHERD